MAKTDNKDPKIDRRIGALDIAAKKLISSIDNGYNERTLLSSKDDRIQEIINNELDLAKGVSKGSIVDFTTLMAKDSARYNGRDPNEVDGYTLFTEDIGNLFGYFQEIYKNRYIELADLKFITKFIPAIGEAVKTTLDSIVQSDDMTETISRSIELGPSLTTIEKAQVMAEIERIETDEKLLKKLRNIVYKKTLVSGNYYVYRIPYNDLFQEYDRLVKTGRIINNQFVNNALARGNISRDAKKKGFNLKNVGKSGLFATEAAAEMSLRCFVRQGRF